MEMMKHPREHDAKHLDFIRSLPCLVCADNTTVEAAHVRFTDLKAGKRSTGMAEKSDDSWAIPMCGKCHRAQHRCSERGFWEAKEIDPVKVALALWKFRDDREMASAICEANRERIT